MHSLIRTGLAPCLFTFALGCAAGERSTAPSAAAAPASETPVAAVPAIAETPAETVRLVVAETTADRVALDVVYHRRSEQLGPRAVELHLRPSAALAFVSGSALEAATTAGKQLVVQPEDGGLRVVLFGTGSLDRLESGGLCRLVFDRKADGAATVEIAPEMPVFAPADANEGVLLGAPLTLGGQ